MRLVLLNPTRVKVSLNQAVQYQISDAKSAKGL